VKFRPYIETGVVSYPVGRASPNTVIAGAGHVLPEICSPDALLEVDDE
jgi:hypothetical protein